MDGFNQQFGEVYAWAYAQVKQDGWHPPVNLYPDERFMDSYVNPPETPIVASVEKDIVRLVFDIQMLRILLRGQRIM